MNVGIMSMQRVVNYGSFLQAYSLKKNIEALGHTVSFVDYHPGEVLVHEDKAVPKLRIQDRVIRKFRNTFVYPPMVSKDVMNRNNEQLQRLNAEYQKYLHQLGISDQRNYLSPVDALVIGSDEVFNCIQSNPDVGFAKELFGAGRKAKHLLSFAASFGNTTANELMKYGIYDEVGCMLKQFDAISVRDKNTKDIVEKYGLNPIEHLDPVFLYDYSEEMEKYRSKESGYIVVYSYACRMSKNECREILKFAKKMHKDVICLCGWQYYLNEYKTPDPFEVLSLIKNADYVITDTFHGTVFSIKFNKKFVTYVREGHGNSYGNSEKITDMLTRFQLTDRIIKSGDSIGNVMNYPVDFSYANQVIRENKENAEMYLENNLGDGNKIK